MTLEERLIELEIRYTHQQRLLEQLDEIITLQRHEIDKLKVSFDTIQRQMESAGATPPNEPPPHY